MGRYLRVALAMLMTGAALRAEVKVTHLTDRTSYDFRVEGVTYKPVTIDGKTFSKAALVGVDGYEAILYGKGDPEIPVLRFFVDGEGDVVVTPGAADDIATRHVPIRIRPSLDSVLKVPGAKAELVFSGRYSSDAFEPSADFEVTELGTVRGVRRRMVTLFPVRYNPAKEEVKEIRKFTVLHRHGILKDAPCAVERETLALVVGKQFEKSPALDRYAAFKRSLGYLTRRIVIGRDAQTAPQIREKLRALYRDASHPLVAAILVGGHADAPAYESNVISGVTDHYFRSLDTDVYESDTATPDIEVGRFVVDTEAALAVVVDKQIRYETGEFQSEKWIPGVSLIASDDWSHWKVAEGSFDYLVEKYTKPLGLLGDFPLAATPGGDLLYAVTHKVTHDQVVDRMRAGRGFINYGGHGDNLEWISPHVDVKDVQSMKDPSAIPFVMANACVTGRFKERSFGEVWQREPSGSIIYWGSMDNTYWDEDDILQRRFYDAMYGAKVREFGKLSHKGLLEMWRYYGGKGRSAYYFETYVTFGDPLTHLRTAPTRRVLMEGPVVNPVGYPELDYRILDEAGRPVPGARVAVVSRSSDYAIAGKTDRRGRLHLRLGEGYDKPGFFDVTISGDDLRLRQATLEIRKW